MYLYPTFLLPLLLATLTPHPPRQAPPKNCLTILSGKEHEGYYFKVAKAIEVVARDNGLPICAVPANKTLYNAKHLAKGKADFAIAQSDVAHNAFGGVEPGGHPVRIVMPLYLEAVHILYRSDSQISRVIALRGKRIYMGARDSGTAFTARQVLSAAGLKDNDYSVASASDYCDAVARLRNPRRNAKRIDAVFRDTIVPSAEIQDFLSNGGQASSQDALKNCNAGGDIELLPLDFTLIGALAKRGYIGKIISSKEYQQNSDTTSVGVPALLLTSKPDHDPDVKQLAEIVRQHRDQIQKEVQHLIEKQHQGGHSDAIPQLSLTDVPVSTALAKFIHPSAADSIPTWRGWWISFCWRTATALALALPLIFWKRAFIRRKLRKQPQIAFAVSCTMLVWFVTSCKLYGAECTVNDHFATLLSSMRYSFLYLISLPGYGLATEAGQLVGQTARWLSVGLLGGFGVPLINRLIQAMLSSRAEGKPEAAAGD